MQSEGVDPSVLEMDPEKTYAHGSTASLEKESKRYNINMKESCTYGASNSTASHFGEDGSAGLVGIRSTALQKPTGGRADLLADIASRRID